MKMKELPQSERPYEKLELFGQESLSNAELLAIIIKTGTKEKSVIDIAKEILNLGIDKNTNSLRFLHDISISEFMKINGIGKVKAIQLKAISELTKRMEKPIFNQAIKIKTPSDVANLLMSELRYEKREIVKVLLLNSKNIIVKNINISLGGTNFAHIDAKDVLAEAVKMQIPKIVLVHNHPSGDATPSKSDYVITDKIFDAAELLGIELLDHIVIGDGVYKSILSKTL